MLLPQAGPGCQLLQDTPRSGVCPAILSPPIPSSNVPFSVRPPLAIVQPPRRPQCSCLGVPTLLHMPSRVLTHQATCLVTTLIRLSQPECRPSRKRGFAGFARLLIPKRLGRCLVPRSLINIGSVTVNGSIFSALPCAKPVSWPK